jgi:glycosyltransferase involved in cell wall biosynthesis
MLSFIIPAYNEEAVLGPTINAIHDAAKACAVEYEVIVADDASTDRTAEIAAQHGARIVSVSKRQIAATRNAGAQAAQGDVFIFVDADTLVLPQTVNAALEAINNGAIGGGAQVGFDEGVPWMARFITSVCMQIFRMLRLAPGCFLYCTRTAFEAAGGFDERFFASEEVWMSKALKQQGKFVMLREPVITSGRKVRDHGTVGIFWKLIVLTLRGPRNLQKREGLELWYDGRREAQDSR